MTVRDVTVDEWYHEKGKPHVHGVVAPKKQVVSYRWENVTVQVEVDQDRCCEYSKAVGSSDVLRGCSLESRKEYVDKKVKVYHPHCPARVYALLYPDCPLRKKQRGEE